MFSQIVCFLSSVCFFSFFFLAFLHSLIWSSTNCVSSLRALHWIVPQVFIGQRPGGRDDHQHHGQDHCQDHCQHHCQDPHHHYRIWMVVMTIIQPSPPCTAGISTINYFCCQQRLHRLMENPWVGLSNPIQGKKSYNPYQKTIFGNSSQFNVRGNPLSEVGIPSRYPSVLLLIPRNRQQPSLVPSLSKNEVSSE